MDFQDKKVLVVGTGISGIGAAGLLVKMGACPVLFDSNDKLKREDILKRAGNEPSLIVLLGSVPDELKEEIGLVVVSPGVPSDSLFIDEFRQRGIPVWGEIELAYACGKGGNHRDKRKDYHHYAYRTDYESLLFFRLCGGKYRNPLYGGGVKYKGGLRGGCGDQQLSAGDDSKFCP